MMVLVVHQLHDYVQLRFVCSSHKLDINDTEPECFNSGTYWCLLHVVLSTAFYCVSQPGETNSVDQRLLELELWEQAKVKVCSTN
jgi:hypothetical protein